MKTARLSIEQTTDEQELADLRAIFGEPYDGPESDWPPTDPAELARLDAYYDAEQARFEERWIAEHGEPPF